MLDFASGIEAGEEQEGWKNRGTQIFADGDNHEYYNAQMAVGSSHLVY